MRILYVENDVTFASVVCAKFFSGHDVTIATRIDEAKRWFATRRFDAVLVDYDLDDGKGSTLVQHLRAARFMGLIIAVSSHRAGNTALERAGADLSCSKRRFAELPRLLLDGVQRSGRLVLRTAQHVEAAASRPCEDRAAAVSVGETLVLVVADGAGGTAGGEQAAVQLVDFVVGRCLDDEACDWEAVLSQADDVICRTPAAGQCTAVALAVLPTGFLSGASVGDSAAFVIDDQQAAVELTENQQRKPLIGSGDARPVTFSGRLDSGGTVLLASDGLVRYVALPTILDCVRAARDQNALCFRLAAAAKAATGSLQDDLAILLCARCAREAVAVHQPEEQQQNKCH